MATFNADDLHTPQEVKQQCDLFRKTYTSLFDEISKVIVGHREVIDAVLISLFAGGNVLLEGVPGLGKTLLVRTLAQTLSLRFSRIQFTPDLMPADVIGTNIVMEDPDTGRRFFDFQRGPIYAQIVLADEINRATPKTQSALLEAMQEQSVTVSARPTSWKNPSSSSRRRTPSSRRAHTRSPRPRWTASSSRSTSGTPTSTTS